MTRTQIMGFSPKVLVALIALGLVATGSIVFNVYFLATKDKALETEVEGLKDDKTKLDKDLSDLKMENEQLTLATGDEALNSLKSEIEDLKASIPN